MKLQQDAKGVYYLDKLGKKVYIDIKQVVKAVSEYVRAQKALDELNETFDKIKVVEPSD
jgi:hypothetical protein